MDSGRAAAATRVAFVLAFALLAAGQLSAQGITVTIDRPEATVQDQLWLTVTVDGSQSAQPQLPELPDFDVRQGGQSSQLSIVNGRATASIGYRFVLLPRRTGTFTIGPATVEIDGQRYQSKPFQVRIVEATASPQEAKELYLNVQVSTKRPVVGQQVIYTWKLVRRVRIADARLEPLEFSGFLVEDLGEVREYQTAIDGQQFVVSELRKALFPQEAGTLTIPASSLTCQVLVQRSARHRTMFDDVFGATATETRVLRSPPITLEVQPLPPAPAAFTGLVGKFRIEAQMSKRQLKVGESATLTLTVSGTGNAQLIAEPRLPELAQLKVYDDKPSSALDRSGAALTGSKSFRKALVPLAAGELILPPMTLAYFDPEAGAFRTSQTERIVLAVSPAAGQEELGLTQSLSPDGGKVEVKILADDLLPITRGLEALKRRPLLVRSTAGILAGLLTPAVAFVGLLLFQRQRLRFELDAGLRRRRRASRVARRGLDRLATESGGDAAVAARLTSRHLRTFIGDKLGLEGSAMTPMEVRAQLEQAGVDADLIARTHDYLQHLEAAQFGAASVDPSALVADTLPLVDDLDRQLRG